MEMCIYAVLHSHAELPPGPLLEKLARELRRRLVNIKLCKYQNIFFAWI